MNPTNVPIGPPVEAQAYLVQLPAEGHHVRHREVRIEVRWRTSADIQLGWRPARFAPGLPPEAIVAAFLDVCNRGMIVKRVRDPKTGEFVQEDGKFVVEAIHDHYEFVTPELVQEMNAAHGEPAPPPPSLLIVPGS